MLLLLFLVLILVICYTILGVIQINIPIKHRKYKIKENDHMLGYSKFVVFQLQTFIFWREVTGVSKFGTIEAAEDRIKELLKQVPIKKFKKVYTDKSFKIK